MVLAGLTVSDKEKDTHATTTVMVARAIQTILLRLEVEGSSVNGTDFFLVDTIVFTFFSDWLLS